MSLNDGIWWKSESDILWRFTASILDVVEMMRAVVLLKDVEAQTERRRFILFCVGLVECLCYFDCFDLETPFPLRLRSLDREQKRFFN